MKMTIHGLKRLIGEILRIKTELRDSEISGTGLFSVEFIPAGHVVSSWVEGIDRTYPADHPDTLPPKAAEEFKKYASWDGQCWCMSGDDGAYFNHSRTPNVCVIPSQGTRPAKWDRVAIRDINPGEELTMDYSEIGEPP